MIIFFAKAPEIGYGKTRLRKFLPDDIVLDICQNLIRDTFENVNGFDFKIYYSGDYSNLSFLNCDINSIPHEKQMGECLGVRMKTAIFKELQNNDKVLLFGSDLVGIDSDVLNETYAALDENDIVIVPTYDGGYGLIGMRKPCDVFTGITYSTPEVLKDTIALAEKQKYSVKVLDEILDIDEFDDLVRAETKCNDIKMIGRGEYNVNYLIEDKVFRINIASQMNLGEKQIQYEFDALRELEDTGVVPKVYDYKLKGKYIPYGFLTMEFLEGRPLDYDSDFAIAARLLSAVHNHDVSGSKLIKADQPFKMMYEEFQTMYKFYKEWAGRDAETERRIDELMAIAGAYDLEVKMKRPSIINTELNNRNFIIDEKSYVIDWEKPIIGDCEQDLAHFMVPTTTNWKTDKILSDEEIEGFLSEYEKYRPVDRELLKQFMMFNTLRGVTWCSMAKVEYSSDRAIQNEDTLKKINAFLSVEFLEMLKNRFY